MTAPQNPLSYTYHHNMPLERGRQITLHWFPWRFVKTSVMHHWLHYAPVVHQVISVKTCQIFTILDYYRSQVHIMRCANNQNNIIFNAKVNRLIRVLNNGLTVGSCSYYNSQVMTKISPLLSRPIHVWIIKSLILSRN